MKQANRNKTMLMVMLLVAGLPLLLLGCSTAAPEAAAVPAAVADVVDEETVAAAPEAAQPAEQSEDAVDTEDAPDDAPEMIAEAPTDECLKCHIEKQRLIDNAAPIIEIVSENEGEG